MTPDEIKALRELKASSTNVVAWYPHPEAGGSVRGPYCRWFVLTGTVKEYEKHLGSVKADVEYCAAAMNALPKALDEIENLRAGYLADENGNEYVAVTILKEKIREQQGRFEEARKTIEMMMARAGTDNAADGCRLIIRTGRGFLEKWK